MNNFSPLTELLITLGLAKHKKQADFILYIVAFFFFLLVVFYAWKLVDQLIPEAVDTITEVPDAQP